MPGRSAGEPASRARPRDEQQIPPRERRRERPPVPATAAAEAGLAQIANLTGKEVEGVTGVQPTDGGWLVEVEVLEDPRVPSTSDMLASYQAELDSRGGLLGYRRTRRFIRGRADGAGPA